MSVQHRARTRWFTVHLQRNEAALVLRLLLGKDVSRETATLKVALAHMLINYLEASTHGEAGNPSYWDARRAEANQLGEITRGVRGD